MKRRSFITALVATAAIAIFASPAEARRRGRRWGGYRVRAGRRTMRRASYQPMSYATTGTRSTGVSVTAQPARLRRAGVHQNAIASGPPRSAQQVSYRWRRQIGQTESLSSHGQLSTDEIQHLASFGPQKAETFNRHLHKRLPASVERLEDGSTINWYDLKNPQNTFVDDWQGEGQNRTYTSQPAGSGLKVGLKFDAQGNYQSLGLGEKDR